MRFQYIILLLLFVSSQVLFSSIEKKSYQAIKTNNIKKVKRFIKKSNVNDLNSENETILNYAIIKGNTKIIKYLLKLKVNLNLKSKINYAFTIKKGKITNLIKITEDIGSNGDTPLLIAIKTQNLKIVKMLVESGADINFEKPNTPLKIAIRGNNIDIVNYLLKKGAKLELVYDSWVTPLFLAIENNNIDILNVLIKNGENLNKKNLKGTSAISYALLSIEANNLTSERFKMIKYLISKKVKFNTRALYYAVNSGSLKLVDLVIEHGCEINLKKEVNGKSLINLIAENGYLKILKKLLKSYKYDKKILDTALFYALNKSKNKEMLDFLISEGANVKYIDPKTGMSILIRAIESNREAFVKYLVKKEANVNLITKFGYTPLMASINNLELSKYLVSSGASINLYNPRHNQNLLAYAISMGNNNNDVIKYLIKKKVSLRNSVYSAAIKFNTEIIKLLLSKKAKINKKYKGNTPLTASVKQVIHSASNFNKNQNIKNTISLLISKGGKIDRKYLESDLVKSHKKLYKFIKEEIKKYKK